MKRRTYEATITENGRIVATRKAHAWNSGIRATEALVRELARERGMIYEGAAPVVVTGAEHVGGRLYLRTWAGATRGGLVAQLEEVSEA